MVITVAVGALCAIMIYYAYFLTVHISVADVRNVMPGLIKEEINRSLERLPPGYNESLDLPLPEVGYVSDTYKGPAIVIADEMDAMPWILDHTNASDKFVADIFGAEVIMGMTTRLSTVGGDWANAPDPVRMMADTNEIYKTGDTEKASLLAKGLNATLVYLPHRTLNAGWWLPWEEVNASKFADTRHFREVYSAGNVTIYRIL